MSQVAGFDASFKAGGDLNTTTSDWQPVRINSAGSVLIANSTTHRVIGILQNRPNSGTGASCWVRTVGFSKVAMNDTCAAGDLIYMGTGGPRRATGLTVTADTQILGRSTEPSAATGTVVQLLIGLQVLHVPTGFTTTAVNAGGPNIVID